MLPQPHSFLNAQPPNQLAAMGQHLAQFGRSGDSLLAHITPREAAILHQFGGSGTTNPHTGLLEFTQNGGSADSGAGNSGAAGDGVGQGGGNGGGGNGGGGQGSASGGGLAGLGAGAASGGFAGGPGGVGRTGVGAVAGGASGIGSEAAAGNQGGGGFAGGPGGVMRTATGPVALGASVAAGTGPVGSGGAAERTPEPNDFAGSAFNALSPFGLSLHSFYGNQVTPASTSLDVNPGAAIGGLAGLAFPGAGILGGLLGGGLYSALGGSPLQVANFGGNQTTTPTGNQLAAANSNSPYSAPSGGIMIGGSPYQGGGNQNFVNSVGQLAQAHGW